jgi:hypothetical protein
MLTMGLIGARSTPPRPARPPTSLCTSSLADVSHRPHFIPPRVLTRVLAIVYVNSLLASLNMRDLLRQREAEPEMHLPRLVFAKRPSEENSSDVGSSELWWRAEEETSSR